MKPIDDTKETVTFRAVSWDAEGRKVVEKKEVVTHNLDTLKHIQKKLEDKGLHRMERHPAHNRAGGVKQPPHKSGHGGKYTWEGPDAWERGELEPAPAAIDEKDPNFVDEVEEERILKSCGEGLVVGEVEVAKVAEKSGVDGVARVDVDPQLNIK